MICGYRKSFLGSEGPARMLTGLPTAEVPRGPRVANTMLHSAQYRLWKDSTFLEKALGIDLRSATPKSSYGGNHGPSLQLTSMPSLVGFIGIGNMGVSTLLDRD